MSNARTPAQIEADIARRQQALAATVDEIAVRLHPKTVMGDAKARMAATVDRTTGQASVAMSRAVERLRAPWVTEDGKPRLERIVPAAVVAVTVIGLVAASARRRR